MPLSIRAQRGRARSALFCRVCIKKNKCNCVVSNIYCRVDAIFRERAWRGIMARTKENFEATMEQKRVSFVKEIPLKSRHGVTELRK